jgi:hypothetical protein
VTISESGEGGCVTVLENHLEFTLKYFVSQVNQIAAGRPYSATFMTTETAHSDGNGMRTLQWHAWIQGGRSYCGGDMVEALKWLSGKDGPYGISHMAGTYQEHGKVTASGWTARGADRPHCTHEGTVSATLGSTSDGRDVFIERCQVCNLTRTTFDKNAPGEWK